VAILVVMQRGIATIARGTVGGLVLVLVLTAAPAIAGADPGDLDETFSGDGKLTTEFPLQPTNDQAKAVAVQDDGGLVVAGSTFAPGGGRVARFMPDGELDPAFGAGGLVSVYADVRAVAIQDDGKIVIAGGTFCCGFRLIRLNPDGSLDTSFGDDGSVDIQVGDEGRATGVAIRADGKLVVAGPGTRDDHDRDFVIARLLPDGTLDPGFSADGVARADFGGRDLANDVALGPGGSTVVVGETRKGERNVRVAIARFRANGARDRSFSKDGRATTRLARKPLSRALDAEVRSDGRIVIAGEGGPAPSITDFALARYRADGRLDRRFSRDGVVLTDFGPSGGALALALQADGKPVATGYVTRSGGGRAFALARYRIDGSLDRTFAADGTVTAEFEGSAWSNAAAIQEDGRIVAAGAAGTGSRFGADFAVLRYEVAGAPDSSFSDDGRAVADIGEPAAALRGLALQPDGRILAAGHTIRGDAFADIAIARYLPNGTLDGTFGDGGTATLDFGMAGSTTAAALAVQPDGRIVVVGATGSDLLIGRLEPDGTPDATFSDDGVATADFGGNFDSTDAVALQPNGMIVVAGTFGHETCGAEECEYESAAALARFTAAGALDPGFSGDGIVLEESVCAAQPEMLIEPSGDIVTVANRCIVRYAPDGSLEATAEHAPFTVPTLWAVARTQDGRLVTAGSGGNTFGVTRHTADLMLDETFDGDGFVFTEIPPEGGRADEIGLQSTGRIVAAGVADDGRDVAIVRYETGGAVDTEFGAGGLATVDFGHDEYARGLVIQPDDTIVVASSSGGRFALARLEAE
jgi:uncharacterized delta-60 repeat protein